jgi:hypothetical protein
MYEVVVRHVHIRARRIVVSIPSSFVSPSPEWSDHAERSQPMKRIHQERSHRNDRPRPGLRISIEQVLLDVAHILQSATGWRVRLLRTFELIAELVPYDRCALREAPPGVDPFLVILPELLPEARAAHNEVLVEHLGRLALGPMPERRGDSGPSEPYLVVPLMGLDEVIGVLHVSRAGEAYSERQWLVLTLIGAQLGAYLTMLRSRAADVVRSRALEEARRSAAAAIHEKDALLALVARELGAGRAVVEIAVEPEGSCEWCARPGDVAPEVSTAPSVPDRLPLDGISVLLVDDDFDIRDAFQLVLEQSGAVVRSAESAEDVGSPRPPERPVDARPERLRAHAAGGGAGGRSAGRRLDRPRDERRARAGPGRRFPSVRRQAPRVGRARRDGGGPGRPACGLALAGKPVMRVVLG